jgi:hypothetical protein
MAVTYKHVTESVFIPALKNLGFSILSKSKNFIEFFYKDNKKYKFFVEKDNTRNAVSFTLFKPLVAYTLRNIVLIRAEERYRKIHEICLDKYFFDTDDELIGIYDFAYGLISQIKDDFYYGNLVDEIEKESLNSKEKNSEMFKYLDNDKRTQMLYQYIEEWKKVRFLERHYL